MTRARPLERHATHDVVALRTQIRKLINVVMDGDYVMDYYSLGNGRSATQSRATE